MSCFSSKYFNRCITLALSYGWQTENFQHFLVLMRSKYVRMSDNTRKWQTVSLDSSLAPLLSPHKRRKSFNKNHLHHTTLRTRKDTGVFFYLLTSSDHRSSLVKFQVLLHLRRFFYYDFCKNSFDVFLTASHLQHTYMG